MASKKETGFTKNVANFQQLISFCTAYGVKYTPSKDNLILMNLNLKHNEAEVGIQSVKIAKTALDNAINDRLALFKPMKKLATRIISALKVSGASPEKIKDAQGMYRKIQGGRAARMKTAVNGTAEGEAIEKKNISVSQQGYDMQISHFEHLIHILNSEVNYNPNENDLKVSSLSTYRSELQQATARVMTAFTAAVNARNRRDTVLFDKNTGLCKVAQDVKEYVRSIYGSGSPEHLQVRSINFSAKRV